MQEKANNPLKQGFQLGKKNSPTGNIFFFNWALFSAQLTFGLFHAHQHIVPLVVTL